MARDKSASLVVKNQRLRPEGARQCPEAVSATANEPTSACQEVTSNSAMPLAKSSSENSSTAEKMSVSFARLFGPPIDNGQGIQWYGYYRQQSNPKKHRFSPAAVFNNNNTYREELADSCSNATPRTRAIPRAGLHQPLSALESDYSIKYSQENDRITKVRGPYTVANPFLDTNRIPSPERQLSMHHEMRRQQNDIVMNADGGTNPESVAPISPFQSPQLEQFPVFLVSHQNRAKKAEHAHYTQWLSTPDQVSQKYVHVPIHPLRVKLINRTAPTAMQAMPVLRPLISTGKYEQRDGTAHTEVADETAMTSAAMIVKAQISWLRRVGLSMPGREIQALKIYHRR